MNFVTSFERIVVQWIARENLFSVGEPLLVALSGGADSVALYSPFFSINTQKLVIAV